MNRTPNHRRKMGPHIVASHRAVGIHFRRWHSVLVLVILAVLFGFFYYLSRVSEQDPSVILSDVVSSLARMVIGYVISAILGFFLAVLLYKNRSSTLLLPLFDVAQSFPTFAALPIAVMFWGPNEFTVIFFLVFTMVWPIFFTIISSLKLVHQEWEEAMQISGIRGMRYIWKFLVPVSVPALITGSIIALGDAWEALIATEIIVGIKSGFGPFFKAFSTNPRVTTFGIVGLLIIVFAINKLVWLPLLESSHASHEE